MTVVEEDRRLLYRQLYKGRRRDLEIHTYADVKDVYKVYAPVWGQWGKMIHTFPEEIVRKRRSRATFSPEQTAFLAKLNRANGGDTVEVVPDRLSENEASSAALSNRTQEESLAVLTMENYSEKVK